MTGLSKQIILCYIGMRPQQWAASFDGYILCKVIYDFNSVEIHPSHKERFEGLNWFISGGRQFPRNVLVEWKGFKKPLQLYHILDYIRAFRKELDAKFHHIPWEKLGTRSIG